MMEFDQIGALHCSREAGTPNHDMLAVHVMGGMPYDLIGRVRLPMCFVFGPTA